MTQILRAESDADFLALVPRLCGYRATDSIVCVLFEGRSTSCAFRIDLPTRRRTADARAVAEFILTTAARIPGVDLALPVVYTGETFAGAHGLPWTDFVDDLLERVHRGGLHLKGALCVAADGWGSYFDDRPVSPRPLDEIEQSDLADPTVADIAERAELPRVGDLERRAFRAATREVCAREIVTDPALLVPVMMERELDTHELARLAVAVTWPDFRDETMLRIAFGELVGDAVAEDNIRFQLRCALEGLSMDEVVERDLGEDGDEEAEEGADELWSLLLGRGRVRPDPDRIETGIAVFGRLGALVDGRNRAAVLCVLGWLHWTLGNGSASGRMLELALEADPLHRMSALLAAWTRHVRYPDWALPHPVREHD